MKLVSVTISNILSYSFVGDIDKEDPTMVFDDDINLLIGPNGSGKSNLLEVIHMIFYQVFNSRYTINKAHLESKTPIKSTVTKQDKGALNLQYTLQKHVNFSDKESLVRVVVHADTNDIKNLEIIKENWDVLTQFHNDYTNLGSEFFKHAISNDKIAFHSKNIIFDIPVKNELGNGSFEKPALHGQSFESFFYFYLVEFNLIQKLFEILAEKRNIIAIPLSSPFILISSLRQHSGFSPRITLGPQLASNLQQAISNDKNSSTKNYMTTDAQYQIVMASVGLEINGLLATERITRTNEILINSTDGILYSINKYLKETLGLQLRFEEMNPTYFYIDLSIWDKEVKISFEQLSSGQKSIFYLLFCVFGSKFGDGLLIVDEPELHLHTSMQLKYKRLLNDIQRESNVQMAIATHSAAFVDETTIHNIFRIYKPENDSKIHKPGKISTSDKELVKMLTYTNSSRIFFADKVILVEGDSDEYFYRYFLENFFSVNFPFDRTVEIIYIGGKGQYKRWSAFLDLYKIDHYYIGDLDNIREFGIAHKSGLPVQEIIKHAQEATLKKMLENAIKVESLDGKALLENLDGVVEKDFVMDEEEKQKLKELWAYMKYRQGVHRQYIVDHVNKPENASLKRTLHGEIDSKYSDRIYILKQGDLETYIDKHKKDLQSVISFCSNDFDSWIHDEMAKKEESKLAELTTIFKHIIDVKD